MLPTMCHSWLQSLSVKNQISLFPIFLSETEGLARNTHGSHTVLTLPIRFFRVDDSCLRLSLGSLVLNISKNKKDIPKEKRHSSLL